MWHLWLVWPLLPGPHERHHHHHLPTARPHPPPGLRRGTADLLPPPPPSFVALPVHPDRRLPAAQPRRPGHRARGHRHRTGDHGANDSARASVPRCLRRPRARARSRRRHPPGAARHHHRSVQGGGATQRAAAARHPLPPAAAWRIMPIHLPVADPAAVVAAGGDVCYVELEHMNYREGYYIRCPVRDCRHVPVLCCTEFPHDAIAAAVWEHRRLTYRNTVGWHTNDTARTQLQGPEYHDEL
uniref:Uncharacterized protein n=1 Tax=Setaria viridis TaxID=4556 RepID=A0A4U6UHB9_SETVI|nr:hypothetical protein SEVIR_6G129900v2 [Setaria viridis]